MGVPAEEPLRLIARSSRTLMLERVSGVGPAIPADRDLVLSGDVRAFPLADLLALLHASGKSGCLSFESGAARKAVFLSCGEVVFAASNLGADRLGASLLRSGALDADQLARAESAYHEGTRFGKIVVELGLLTPRDLWAGVKTQVEEIVRSLFSYTVGWLHFWEGEIEPDNVVRLRLPTGRLIDEGLERCDELLRFLAHLEEPRTRLRRGPQGRTPDSDNERAVVEAVSAVDRFAPLCRRAALDPRTAARTLQYLALTGHVLVEKAEESVAGEFTTADDDVVREAVTLQAGLVFELAAPLVALDGATAVAERLNRIVDESVAPDRPLLDALRFDARASLDPQALEHRALRLAGDRVRAVDDAFSELVSYLEFELKNHPRIDDCRPFLDAVEPIRMLLAR